MKPTQTAEQLLTKTEQRKVIIKEEKLPLFSDLLNPNKDIFVVPTQEGADKDDQWNGSIGDATLEHLYQMKHRALEMEGYYCSPDGNLFRLENNVSWSEDSEELQKKRIMEAMAIKPGRQIAQKRNQDGTFGTRVVTDDDKENVVAFLLTELQEQRDKREESQDALDQALVPFDDWESMPQMTKHIDIPSTPVPLYIYAGNCTQMFYDYFPEDHPDKKLINQFLSMLNGVDWDDFQQEQMENFSKWLLRKETLRSGEGRYLFRHLYAIERLLQLTGEIMDSDNVQPDALTQKALLDIEQDWAQAVYSRAFEKANEDSILKEFKKFEGELQVKFDRGQFVYRDIKEFGQKLYKKYGRGKMNPYHWTKYSELKTKFSPRVMVYGNGMSYDVNRANFRQLTEMLGEDKARRLFFKRPFFAIEDLIKAGELGVENLGFTDNNSAFVMGFQIAYKQAKQNRDMRVLTKLAQKMYDMQDRDPKFMAPDEWAQIWQAYRVLKNLLQTDLSV